MYINVNLDGVLKDIVTKSVKQGFASTSSDAVRLAILEFGNRYRLIEEDLDELIEGAVAKKIVEEYRAGKIKSYSYAQILKEIKS